MSQLMKSLTEHSVLLDVLRCEQLVSNPRRGSPWPLLGNTLIAYMALSRPFASTRAICADPSLYSDLSRRKGMLSRSMDFSMIILQPTDI
ncbi:BZ3500_MvSof-1268-A1-R1_Chr3-2g06217 [Microbotryum saponariae]|uniref:BZ3500_MvSof-1268-A1-R1_Chr3-2g06217 protein n=1 Tax=Microbotryum saponariae TaxID=289078 RepID=A0A2X0LXI1_9BASI|nr:BZ3500_MvSof-1268-A1-R1_Chr3-2g06217 [Microbotryum saponariae]SDA04133.1 BZ3501_MvSof-1269-A2-R1_Chr3-2g05908 [Microbotryum saponariae]